MGIGMAVAEFADDVARIVGRSVVNDKDFMGDCDGCRQAVERALEKFTRFQLRTVELRIGPLLAGLLSVRSSFLLLVSRMYLLFEITRRIRPSGAPRHSSQVRHNQRWDFWPWSS